MFGTIRKHQTWLWAIIITITVISFVVFFSPYTRLDNGFSQREANGEFGSIKGRPITVDQMRNGMMEMRLSYFLRTGGREWPNNDEATARSMEREAVSRIFILEKLKEMNISPSEEAVGRMMKDRIGDFPADKFEAEVLLPGGVTWQDFERFIRHEAAILQLVSSAAISARLVNPRDAEAYFRKENEELAVQLGVFFASNYVDQVMVTPAALSNYFNIHAAAYRIPRRITVSYVEFAATNFLAEADKFLNTLTNLEAFITEQYARRGTNYFTSADGKPLPEAEAKTRMKEEIRLSQALTNARREASAFGNDLYSQSDANQATNLFKLAAAKGYAVKTTAPFDSLGGLDTNAFPEAFRAKALTLSTNQPIAFSPIVGSNAVFVIARHSEVPSEMPSYDQVRAKVLQDYKNSEAVVLARNAGQSFERALTNGLAAKKSFLEVATAEKAKTVIVPPFSMANAESLTNLTVKINPRMIAGVAGDLEVGKASPFIPLADGGMVAFLSARIPAPDAKVKAELPEFMARLRAYRQGEAFNHWFRRQAELSQLSLPQRDVPNSPAGGSAQPQ